MDNEKYRFTRTENTQRGFFSSNTVGTDALNALSSWKVKNASWEYSIESDLEEQLVALLSVPEADLKEAGICLLDSCIEHGVERTHIESTKTA